ncbi:MAG TPA: hypothetical protein VFQ67_16525 [Allosphingosinicella sp.]|nr:hypothetical protein [Allosphingosinicella sp.]
MKTYYVALALGLLAAAAPASAQEADDILSKVINAPLPGADRVDGASGRVRNDPAVQGGKALRIEVPGKSEKAWAVALSNPINKPVKMGDNIVLAFWARLAKGENGATSATLPYNAVQLAEAPYTPLFKDGVTIAPEWKMYEIRGRADRDYSAGSLNVTLHLATGRQTVDIGPIFVLDMGQ